MNRNWSSQGTPRSIPAGIGWTLIAFGVFFLAAVIMKDTRRAAFGQFADGEIVKITERTSSGGGGTDKHGRRKASAGVSHVLTVRYTPGNGEPMEVETLATWGFSEKVGDRVRMIYLPDRLDDAEIYSFKQIWLPLATGFTLSALCLGGGTWIVRRRRRLIAATA
jgi:hypothetical protein